MATVLSWRRSKDKSRPLAAFLIPFAVLVSAVVTSALASAAGKPGGVRLPTASETIRKKLKPLEASMKAREAVSVKGDTLTYDSKTDVYTAIGNAKAVEGTTTLTGDVISLHNRTHIHAIGHVHLIDLDSNIVASEGTLDLATEEATLYHAKVYAFDRSYYLTGTKIQKTLGQHYRAENALLTTCTCDSDNPDWSLTAKEMNLHLNGEMRGYSGDFDVLGHPLIPLPFLEYNTDPTVLASGSLAMRQPYHIRRLVAEAEIVSSFTAATVACSVRNSVTRACAGPTCYSRIILI